MAEQHSIGAKQIVAALWSRLQPWSASRRDVHGFKLGWQYFEKMD